MNRGFLFTCVILLAACESKNTTVPDGATIARAASLVPADPRLAGLYAQSCRLCHTVPGSLAPLTGDEAAWKERMNKGMPALVQSVVVGLNGMPPAGQCFACTKEDYEALIGFMAGKEKVTRE